MRKEPILIGRYWHMPDGGVVPNIYGAKDGEEENKDLTKATDDAKAARKEAAGYRVELREIKETLKGFEGIDVEAYKSMIDEKSNADTKKKEDEGQYQELLDENNRRHETAMESATKSITEWKGRFEKLMVDNELISSAGNAVDPKSAVTLVRAAHEFVITDTGSVEIKQDGSVMLDKAGKPVVPAALMTEYLDSHPYLVKAQNKDGGGTHPNSGDNRKGDGVLTSVQKIEAGLKKMNV